MAKVPRSTTSTTDIERMYRRMADQLEKAGDRCRVKKGGKSCNAFDVTADVLRRVPRFFDREDYDPTVEEADPRQLGAPPSQVVQPSSPPPVTPNAIVAQPPPAPKPALADAAPSTRVEPADPIKAAFADAPAIEEKGGGHGQP
jgi:hypothetical protein